MFSFSFLHVVTILCIGFGSLSILYFAFKARRDQIIAGAVVLLVLSLLLLLTGEFVNITNNDESGTGGQNATHSAVFAATQFSYFEFLYTNNGPISMQTALNISERDYVTNWAEADWAGVPGMSAVVSSTGYGSDGSFGDFGWPYENPELVGPESSIDISAWIGYCHLTVIGLGDYTKAGVKGSEAKLLLVMKDGKTKPLTYKMFVQYTQNQACRVTPKMVGNVDPAYTYNLDYAFPGLET